MRPQNKTHKGIGFCCNLLRLGYTIVMQWGGGLGKAQGHRAGCCRE